MKSWPRPEEIINCDPGYIMIGGIRIHDSHHIGTVTLEKAYAESSDVGAVKMALRLGPERFYKHIQDYGFGQLTNIELPGETRGLVRNPDTMGGLFDWLHGDRTGDWSHAAAGGLHDVVDCQRRHLFVAAHRCRSHAAQPGIPAHRVSSPGAAPRHLLLHGCDHAPADRRGGAGGYGAPRHSGRLHLGGKDRHRGEGRSAYPRLFEDGLCMPALWALPRSTIPR